MGKMSGRRKGFLSEYRVIGRDTARRVPTVLVIVVIPPNPRVGARK
jgi:hypothetical protein